MAVKPMRETDLYAPVKAFLEGQGYEVKGEIGSADVVGVRGSDDLVIVELKTGFSLSLFHQGIERLSVCDAVYVAVPRGKGKQFQKSLKNNKTLCRRLGLGLITVRIKDDFVEVHLDPVPYSPRKSKKKQSRLLKEFAKLEGDPNTGGATRQGLMTAYRQDAIRCLGVLYRGGPQKAASVAKQSGVEQARRLMADNHYGWFEKVERGVYALSKTGQIEVAKNKMDHDILVSVQWLKQNLQRNDLVILDCTNFSEASRGGFVTVSGRGQWEVEHIEGARFADFTSDLCGDNAKFRNTLPEPEDFALAMGRLGIGDSSKVILYDSDQSMWASRVWWMLRWIGFDNAAVLDGGIRNWIAAGGATASGTNEIPPRRLSLRLRPEVFVDRKIVRGSLDDASVQIIDSLSQAQFEGTRSELGLSGHIQGAINIPAAKLVDEDTGLYLPFEKLASLFPGGGHSRTIVYCGSGIAASATAFTLHRLATDNVSIYMPGLQEWMDFC